MPKIDVKNLPVETVTLYPDPFHKPLAGRSRQRLGNAVAISQFGVNLTTLKPGSWSSQRHWHATEDEFIYVLEGELVLKENHGETVLKAGDCAGWKAGGGDGHCLINRTDKDAVYIEVGTRKPSDTVVYSDIDMRLERDKHGPRYLHKNGEPYPPRKP
ncbi:MAG: cupin domain-containing protein [Alphaproteobacteria bacterium]|nr:cupin domain-containing protein [Alphaproteobacteria bacterium]